MNTKNLIRVMTAVIVTLGLCAAEAGPRNRRVGRTEVHQSKRIGQGVRSGELTRGEAKELRTEQRDINKMRKEAKRDDGHIDKGEMKEIRKEQVDASKNIYQEKHDSEQRQQ